MNVLMMLIMMTGVVSIHGVMLHVNVGEQSPVLLEAPCVKVVCICVQVSAEGEQVVRDMCHLFDMTGQVTSTVIHRAAIPVEAEQIRQWSKEGYDFAIYVQMIDTTAIRWWLYDTAEVTMIAGTRFQRRPSLHQCAQALAAAFWRAVMGGPSSFGSEIAYVKKTGRGKRRQRDVLCAASWDTGEERCIVERSTAVIAPSWYTLSSGDRAILFSEMKPTHVGLMMWHKDHISSIALPHGHEGTIVGVAQHPDYDTFVYCHSGDLWRYERDVARGKVLYRKFSDPEGPCICPTVLSNGDIIYGAGNKIKRWDSATNTIVVIVGEGYCIAPTCHEGAGVIVYSRRTQGIVQLWFYDMVRNTHRQLTHGQGDKTDPSISPCGNLVAFCHEKKAGSVICILNMVTGSIRSLTSANEYCAYPAWSPEFSL